MECWAVGDLLPGELVVRTDGSMGTSRRMRMFDNDDGGIMGVDILTWSPYSSLYPPSEDGLHTSASFTFGSIGSYVILYFVFSYNLF